MTKNSISEKLKGIKGKQIVYPAVVSVFIALVVFVFTLSAKFLSANINKAFLTDEKAVEPEVVKLDLANYHLVAKKLGIIVESAPTPPQEVPRATNTTPASATSPTPTTTGKGFLKIEVLNGTPINGLDVNLASLLTGAGFSVVKTGNEPTPAKETLLRVRKNENAVFVSEVKNIVSKKYRLAGDEILPDGNEYDVVIIIGAK